MKATKITIEFSHNESIEFFTYKNMTVWSALKYLKKQFGEVLIYNINTQY
jgi:hypothetical protein